MLGAVAVAAARADDALLARATGAAAERARRGDPRGGRPPRARGRRGRRDVPSPPRPLTEVVYADLLPGERRRLHEAVADGLPSRSRPVAARSGAAAPRPSSPTTGSRPTTCPRRCGLLSRPPRRRRPSMPMPTPSAISERAIDLWDRVTTPAAAGRDGPRESPGTRRRRGGPRRSEQPGGGPRPCGAWPPSTRRRSPSVRADAIEARTLPVVDRSDAGVRRRIPGGRRPRSRRAAVGRTSPRPRRPRRDPAGRRSGTANPGEITEDALATLRAAGSHEGEPRLLEPPRDGPRRPR